MAIETLSIGRSEGIFNPQELALVSFTWVDEQTRKKGKYARMELFDFLERGGEAFVLDDERRRVALVTVESYPAMKYVKAIGNRIDLLLGLERM